ncbi:MAG TPA: menaquinone biosynthesis protein [Acidobacteriaceae bacterium]
MAPHSSTRLRVAAIRFLNPAPLMWDFDHPPRAAALAERYELHSTTPALCADELLTGRADLGLIPIASLTPELAIVPGCAIASLDRVRSIQLIVKLRNRARVAHSSRDVNRAMSGDETISIPDDTNLSFVDSTLRRVRSVAADTASRSSLVYAQLLFRKFVGQDPEFLPAPADPIAMLAQADAALLIGDPALLALEDRARIEAAAGPCLFLDLAHQWHARTGLPWVAAVWAVRAESLAASSQPSSPPSATALIADLTCSRDHGLANLDALVAEWSPRIALPPATIRHYLTRNIHYTLDDSCIAAIHHLRALAAEASLLPPLPNLSFLK